jgi:hypothetical protein
MSQEEGDELAGPLVCPVKVLEKKRGGTEHVEHLYQSAKDPMSIRVAITQRLWGIGQSIGKLR